MGRSPNRQERWLHARISGDLEEVLKREARRRRQPVSLLVRNVLEGAFDLVEDIVDGSLDVARRSQRLARTVRRATASTRDDTRTGDAPAVDAGDLADVYGWQELILNRADACARCATRLVAGAKAFRGLRERPGPPAFLCAACTRRLHQPAGD